MVFETTHGSYPPDGFQDRSLRPLEYGAFCLPFCRRSNGMVVPLGADPRLIAYEATLLAVEVRDRGRDEWSRTTTA